jgi:hypothetical protein
MRIHASTAVHESYSIAIGSFGVEIDENSSSTV